MDSMEINKAASAILVAGIAFMVSGVISDQLVHPAKLAKPAIEIVSSNAPPPSAAAPVAAPLPPIAPLLAKADPAAGEADVKKLWLDLPQLRGGRPGHRGAEPVWDCGRAARAHGRLQLLERDQEQEGPLDV